MLNLIIICGGPSQERGISLNSARSFLDQIYPLALNPTVLYVDPELNFHQLTPGQLYSNTPSDFDFKLAQISEKLNENELISLLKKADIVFPLIHGIYGEDGALQSFLEKNGIPFVGSPSKVCSKAFNKHSARQWMEVHGFHTQPCLHITSRNTSLDHFWQEHQLRHVIVKPAMSGSSIGVKYAGSLQAAMTAIEQLWKDGFHELVMEPFCEDKEFTICVLESHHTIPVSLIPLEIDIGHGSYDILDYRKKYLPTEQTRYYCPPRFSDSIIDEIRREAERLFRIFGLRDFARIDGWVSKDGKVRFSDLNPLSGMEQNSFIFQQSSRAGIPHTELIRYVIENALRRYHKPGSISYTVKKETQSHPVYVLMGGTTSERQVSLMSGTNVWLKLMHSTNYSPVPYLLEQDETVWQMPYAYTLHHTVEETVEHCQKAEEVAQRVLPLAEKIRKGLGLTSMDSMEMPQRMNLEDFILQAKHANAFVFIALHGGMGENGALQKRLENNGVNFNGSISHASELCMDKYLTALCVESLNDPGILAMPQVSFQAGALFTRNEDEISEVWERAVNELGANDLIIKPQCDGCSTGVVQLHSAQDFCSYVASLHAGKRYLSPGSITGLSNIVEMPVHKEGFFLLEPFIQTDKAHIQGKELIYRRTTGWCEMTIGVLERYGEYTALHPSITVAENHVLSLEEKFQGGTGINITPPPERILSSEACVKVQKSVCKVAKALGIKNYARLDIFVECASGTIRIIEANTLPALTPSTVIYHQALNEPYNMSPRQLLTHIIESAKVKIIT